jgi:23S rRNA pseudouridine2457 synthase
MHYLVFHKPYGVLSQFTAEGNHHTLRDYITVPGVYAAGRLDADSEGLLLLTDDGVLQHRLTEPKFQHPRTYWAQVERIPDEHALIQLRTGVIVKDYRTRPAQAKLLAIAPDLLDRDPPIRQRQNIPTAWLELVLTEGKNRQVRRMTAAVGFPTLRLVRVAIGSIQLADLAPGHWRGVTDQELQEISSSFKI